MRINEEIRAREVRVIAGEGEQLGIMSGRDALQLAQERHLDLVEIAPTAKPPVCRIMDYENVVDNLKNLKSQLDGIFEKNKQDS